MKKIALLFANRRSRIIAFIIVGLILFSGGVAAYIIAKNNTSQTPPASDGTASSDLQPGTNDDSPSEESVAKTEETKKEEAKKTNPSRSSGSANTQSNSNGSGTSSGSNGNTDSGTIVSTAQSCPAYPAFPDAACTGVPSGVSLSIYSGPCTITANNTVIDTKTVNCSLSIQATNVVIKNSRINGMVTTPNNSLAYSFSITDSEVIAGRAGATEVTGIGEANFSVLRVEVTGGNRSIYCRKNCTVQDSWVHGQNIADSPRVHASGIRQSQGATIIHNRIHCSAEDTSTSGGCSANLTGYGDFEPVQDNTIEKNLFVATPAGACAYGGSSGDDGSKPYGHLAQNIIFKDNIFERGPYNCGYYFPITDFDDTRPGSQWINNRWDDGTILPPAN